MWCLVALAALGAAQAAPLRTAAPRADAPTQASGALPEAAHVEGVAYPTIQAAIDAAPADAVVEVAPGRHEESLRVSKPLTLMASAAAVASVRAPSASQSALVAARTAGVAVSGLTFIGSAHRGVDERRVAPVVLLRDVEARMEGCAIVGGHVNGLVIEGPREVVLAGCLIAGHPNDGVVIAHRAAARLSACDVRTVGHYGVVIGPGAVVTIEGSRLSGAGFHGLRYDSAAPRLLGNVFFDNERSHIYTSGATAATIVGNHFHGRASVGFSSDSRDELRQNTFTDCLGLGPSFQPGSECRFEQNLVLAPRTSRRSMGVPVEASVDVLRARISQDATSPLWSPTSAVALRRPPGPPGSEVSQGFDVLSGPLTEADLATAFVDAAGGDFTLAPDSAARLAELGAAEPLSMVSPWPTSEAEEPLLALRRRATAVADGPSWTEAERAAEPWQRALRGGSGPVTRESRSRALSEVRAALAHDDAQQQLAGLYGLAGSLGLADVSFDAGERAELRALVLPHLDSPHGVVQVRAFYALVTLGPQSSDLARLVTAVCADAPGWGPYTAFYLLWTFADGRIEGEVDALLRELLAHVDTDEQRGLHFAAPAEQRDEVLAWAFHTIAEVEDTRSVRQLARFLERSATEADLPELERLLAAGVADREARESLELLRARLRGDQGD